MGDKTKLSISPIFFNLMASLTTTAMGQTWYFVRENGKIASRKCDEEKGIILMNMELDDYAFSFEENEITFHNLKEFLGALKIQDFPKSDVALTRQPYRGTDSILLKNGKSNIHHLLSSKDRYATRYGFDQFADISAMVADADLPKMLCFDLTKETIQAIYEKASKFKSEILSFSKNSNGVVINFTSESDKICEYSYDLDPTEVINFDTACITSETKFPYSFFHVMRAANVDTRLYVFGTEGRGILAFKGEFLNGNVNVKFEASCPSRI